MLIAGFLLGLAPLVPLAPSPALASSADFAIHAKRIVTGAQDIADGVLVVKNGDIAAVGPAAQIATDGLRVIEHDGVLSAGLIACRAFPSVVRDANDSTRTMLPEAQVSDGVAPSHEDFALLRKAGITSVLVTPASSNYVGGQASVFKTDGSELRESSHLAISLAKDTTDTRRGPTSLPGALDEIRAAIDGRAGVWADVADLRMPLFIDVDDRAALRRAVDLCKDHKLGGALYRAHLAGEVRDLLRTSRLGVVSEPLTVGYPERELRAIVALAEIDIPLAFGLDQPLEHPEGLRLSAAMCLQAGMSRAAAWRALTTDAARIAGVASRVGRLEVGLDADLVLWSGDPLDLASSVQAVYIDGRHVSTGNAAGNAAGRAEGTR